MIVLWGFPLSLTIRMLREIDYTRIGSNKGKTPEHNQAKHTKHPHSLEWHNSAITIILLILTTTT